MMQWPQGSQQAQKPETMDNKKPFVRCRHFFLSVCLMLTAHEVNGGLSDYPFIFITSSSFFNAISVSDAGISRKTFTIREEDRFIIAEEIRLDGPTGRLRVSATDYVTNFLVLTPAGRAAIAANPDAIMQAEALSFATFFQDDYPSGTVGTLLSNIGMTRPKPYNQQGHDPFQAQLAGTLYINPSISASTGGHDFTRKNDILALTFSNIDTTREPKSFNDPIVEGRVLENGSYSLRIRIGQLNRAYIFHVPRQLILNPVASFYIPSPTPEVPVPERRALPSVKGPQPGQSEVSQANERTDVDIAVAVYFYPGRGSHADSANHPSNPANTDIIFVQRSGPAESTDLNSPNEEKETSPKETIIKYSFFSMYSAVLAAAKKRRESQSSAPEKKLSLQAARSQMEDAMAHLEGYQEELACFTGETRDISLVNPKDIEQLIHYTRLLIQLHSDYIASGKMTNRELINEVDKTLLNSRLITIWFLNRLESEPLLTRGGLEGSDVLPVQLLAELCDGLPPPNHTKLKTLISNEGRTQALLDKTCEFVLKLIIKLISTYKNKEPTFTLAFAHAWQDLRRVISFLAEQSVFDLGMTPLGAWSIKHEISCIATEMGDIDTLLLLMQLTEEQLSNAGPEHLLVIQHLFNETLRSLVSILQQMDLPSANFTSFIESAKLLKLDTSPLKNAIGKWKQDKASALAEKSEKIKQKADTWAEEEKRKSDKLRQKMQDYQKKVQGLREKRHQAAKQHGKKPEPQSPALTTATASDTASEKNTVEQNSRQPLYEQGRLAFTEERYKDALQHYLDVLSITSDPLQRARIMSSIADCYFFWGNVTSRLRDLLAKAYDYYEDAEWAVLSGNYPKHDKSDFFKLLRTTIAAIDDDLIESVRQAYRWHVEAIDELQGITEEKKANYDASEVEELLSLLILEAEDQDNLASTIKDGVITLNKASELRRQAVNNKKPEQRQSQREEEKKVLKQLSHLQEKVTSQPVRRKEKEKGKKKGQPEQIQHPVEAEPFTSIETELQRLETGEASYQQQLSEVLAGFREGVQRAIQIKRHWEKKIQRSKLSASGASASDASKASPPSGESHDLSQDQLNELLYSSGIRGYEVVNVPYNNWCMFDAIERWLNLLPERDNSVNNPGQGFELFYSLAPRAKLMAEYDPDDPELNQIAATFLVDGPGRQAWGTTEILHRLIAPVLNLNILVLGVDFSEGHPVLTSAMYSRDAITPVPPEERDSAINGPDTIAILHINNHWQAVLPAAGPAVPASTGGNVTDTTENVQLPPIEEPGLQGLEILTPEAALMNLSQ